MNTHTTAHTTSSAPQPITLEEIRRRKTEVRLQINEEKKHMQHTVRELLGPLDPTSSQNNGFIRSFHTGMAIFDGVVMGIKIMRKVKIFLRKLR